MKRRNFIINSLTGTGLAVASVSGLFIPNLVLASSWPRSAFSTTSQKDAVQELFGSHAAVSSSAIKIDAPIQAENGNVVPVKVKTTIDKVETIAIVVENNPRPLATSVILSGKTKGLFGARIKMGETSKITAYVKANGKLFTASRKVKVTIGGCGG